MAEWILPVYDRTQGDVNFAISKIAEWRKSGSKDVYELKGCLNVSDINRIENNMRFLSDELSALYYFPHADCKSWDKSGLLNTADVNRIIGNLQKIINAYYQRADAPDVPNNMLTYSQVNDIEENLYLIKNILDEMIPLFRECGTFSCGEE